MSKPSRVIVVLEDDHHEMLIRRYLINCGLKRHAMRIYRSPSGQGSAESWVLKRFVEETNVYRNRQARALTDLIVMIDADTRTVQEKTVGKSERIARLVPKRNVETWILFLNEQPVDEKTDYKGTSNNWNELIPHAAKNLCRWTRSKDEPPNHCVGSLRIGVRELKRLSS